MILGSHNTMTYLKPRKWWMRLGSFMARCQNKSIEKQYELGARWFDIRIAFIENKDKILSPIFSHGLVEYKNSNIEEVFNFLNEKKAYCRIVLEKGGDSELYFFKLYIAKWLKNYPNIKVTQIAKKGDWDNLYPDKTVESPCSLKDCYASTNGYYPQYENLPGILRSKTWSGYILDDLWPWIYAKFHNKKNLEKYKNEDIILLLDFIGTK